MRWSYVVWVLFASLVACSHSSPTVPAPEGRLLAEADLPSVYRRLERAGFQPGRPTPDDFTPLSHAIRRFQGYARLPETGTLNQRTWELIQRLYDPGPDPGVPERPPLPPVRLASATIQPVGSPTESPSAAPGADASTGTPPQVAWPTGVLTTVQTTLAELGHDIPAITGILDAPTQQALRQFQQSRQLPAHGELTQATLFALLEARCQPGCQMTVLVSAAADDQSLPSAAIHIPLAGTDWESVFVQGVQTLLTRQGYALHGADGTLDMATQQAVRAFQHAARLPESGELTGETVLALLAESCPDGCAVALTVQPQGQAHAALSAAKAEKSRPKKLPPERRPEPRPLQVDDAAYASEKIECSPISGDWVVLYQGTIVEQDEATVALRLEERFGYRYYPNQDGIHRTDWWCIPRRRHCYAPIAFSDWGGTFTQHSVQRFPRERVHDARPGLINSMSRLLQQHCQR